MDPKVSCLMVTNGRRPALTRRAIECFARQTYTPRELVVVCDGVASDVDQLRADLAAARVEYQAVFPAPAGATLGALRNLSLRAATGALVCQWDDDDAYHPDRLRVQVAELVRSGAPVCYLTEHLHYIATDRSLAWVDWMRGGAMHPHQFFPGSLLARRDLAALTYPETGPRARAGEDSALACALAAASRFSWIRGRAGLYVYTYHGGNTYSETHHRGLRPRALELGELTADHRAEIAVSMRLVGLDDYTIAGPTMQSAAR